MRKDGEKNDGALLKCKGLTVKYKDGTTALEDVSLEIPAKGITSVIGSNGSGKTTLARTSLKLIQPVSGSIVLAGLPLRRLGFDRLTRIAAYSPSNPSDILFEDSVAAELSLRSTYDSKSFADEILSRLQIAHLSNRFPETLSLGEQRRLTLAMTLANKPRLVFLDEPSIGLDTQSLDILIDILLELRHEMSLVILTHDVDSFLPLSDHMVALDGGRVALTGPPRTILTRSLAEKLRTKVPDLWDLWIETPNARTWDDLVKTLGNGDAS